ncbi:MAG: hypothetical protein E6H50_12025 [Betaproteobacteria bacterium]|nr:MAG: hypothetical protein E6H70_01060 [Betaproteobacteria bacterium]TMH47608.1 MAG: hypothetical protein E6H50_12025 [Betaproteobacteria bacterium]TMH80270.1 MAG: hypothetical protein E6H51_01900 [Betaproteobacteria bacterium]
MEIPFKEVAGALGAVAVALLGLYQWRRTKRSGRFLEDREAAYKAVWDALEQVHLHVRSESFNGSGFDEHVRTANTLMIKYGLHISQHDKELAAQYMNALELLGAVLSQMASDHPTRREFAKTLEFPPMPDELAPAFSRVTKARDALTESFRRAVGAGQI